MTKKSGIRKPWMAEKTNPESGILLTIRDDPERRKNEREACRTIPSSMATARRASRSDRRAKAGSATVSEDMVVNPPELAC